MGDVKDHGKDQSRWSALLQHLDEAAPEVKALAEEEKIDVVYRAFGADVVEFDPAQPLPPTDPRTDIGAALRKVNEEFAGRKPRAVLVLSDGADTGGVYNTLDEARRFRALPCPVPFMRSPTATRTRRTMFGPSPSSPPTPSRRR